MERNEEKSNVDKSTLGKEKNKVKKIQKKYVDLKASERANLKQFSKRKFISQKALKQIFALLLFDKRRTMTEVMEELALSPQTLMQWRKDFKVNRMDSLFVILEKKKEEEENDDDNVDESENIGEQK